MEKIRKCIFKPYGKGRGPIFTLTLFDLYRRDSLGKNMVGYELRESDAGVIFKGEDFACSPIDSIDSNSAVRSLMGFLTCCPGDTDSEYFEDYTPEQLTYCEQHAESLSLEILSRFGDE